MSVQINEIIIRAIITSDDKHAKSATSTTSKQRDDEEEERKIEILDLIEEVIKSKKER